MSSLADRTRVRKLGALRDLLDFPAHLTAKLGNVDSRNITCDVVLATLDRWKISHANGVADLRRSGVRNLRRALFGPRGVRVRPEGKGTMDFQLFDGFLHLEFEEAETWHEVFGRPKPGAVRLSIKRSDNERRPE